MSITTLKSKIVSLGAELEVLREETKHMTFSEKKTPKKSFASLEGILEGKGQFSEKEIEESEIHLVITKDTAIIQSGLVTTLW